MFCFYSQLFFIVGLGGWWLKFCVRPNRFLDAAFNQLDPKNTPLFKVEVFTLTYFCLFPPSKR
jgi:hypothetical protein